ncbi:GSCOCG00000814001-RA-CDS [Cotesia congregata]|nr:GSCOCG00000814001-RA-CDS [Cotesia congregata]
MNTRTIIGIICIFFTCNVNCFIDPITGGAIAAGFGLFLGFNKIKCSFSECCDKEYIPHDIGRLNEQLEEKLFGQHIAHDVVTSALRAHIRSEYSPKALTMSFHGTPGTGKNFVAQNIVKYFYKEGSKSKYYHFFSGRLSFPLEKDTFIYEVYLKETIINSLLQCPKSLFVFDEVDMIPPRLLNVLVPFLEYGEAPIWHRGRRIYIDKNSAIFIFLSNTGSQEIVETLHNLWQNGRKREDTKLSDFEELISRGAFNEKGGFHKSDTISTSLIDHYVPFLPLETEHVVKCIKAAFYSHGRNPTNQQIEDVMSHVTFSEPVGIFAKAGCKRIEQKVARAMYTRSQ